MRINLGRIARPSAALIVGGLCGSLATFVAANRTAPALPVIAFVPRTAGTTYTEDMRRGAQAAARTAGYEVYWNAATREDDLDRQILIAENAIRRGAKALILGPSNVGGVTTMVDSLVARKFPVVIVQTEAPIPTGPYLTSVTANQSEFGRLAAERIRQLTGGEGEVAIVGIDRGTPETLARSQSFMKAIAAYPDIKAVTQSPGSVYISEAEQNTREIVKSYPGLKAIYAVSADATQGAMLALQDVDRGHAIALVGSDRDLFWFDNLQNGKLDSLVTADGYRIGYLAMRAAINGTQGHPLGPPEHVEVDLLTRDHLEVTTSR